MLEAALAAAQELSSAGGLPLADRCFDGSDPLPYEEVSLPFVLVARRWLAERTGRAYALVAEQAHATLERQLLIHLSALSARVLQVEFSVYRSRMGSALSRLAARTPGGLGARRYRAFVAALLAGGLAELFLEYSVLARLMSVRTAHWVEAGEELLTRLDADQAEILQAFGEPVRLGGGPLVVAVSAGLSDMHGGGRTVLAATLASGTKLIYKPRDLRIEEAYFGLIGRIRDLSANGAKILPLRALKVVSRPTHGWVESVAQAPCESEDAAQRFFVRAGHLVCLAYVLGATDLHQENIIACDEQPVPIDLETLMHPVLKAEPDDASAANVQHLANRIVSLSVMRSGLLPSWAIDEKGKVHDSSGLNASIDNAAPSTVLRWRGINSDAMAATWEAAPDAYRPNRLILNGQNLPAGDYPQQIVDGFSSMYRFLRLHRRDSAVSGAVAAFSGQRLRFVARPTGAYIALLERGLDPALLRSGLDRSIEFDLLARGLLHEKPELLCRVFLRAELEALEQLDVPHFAAISDQPDLIVSRRGADDVVIEGCLEQSGYDCLLRSLERLDEDDLERQASVIRTTLYASRSEEMHVQPFPRPGMIAREAGEVSPARLEEEAGAIAHELKRLAVTAADGSVTWMGLAYHLKARRQQIQPLGYGLYDGTGGIALFLSTLEAVTGQRDFHDLALGCLSPLQSLLGDPAAAAPFVEHVGIGGATGLGSIIYSLVRSGVALGEDWPARCASLSAELITDEAISSDLSFDVISGSAGAILGLLSLGGRDGTGMDRAVACGRYLLKNSTAGPRGGRAWPTLGGRLLTGFSHGAAGIAYALLRLFQATGETTFRDAAEEAIAYERSVFLQEEGNWPDYRDVQSNLGPSPCAWCHGAVGIGIARLGSLDVLHDTRVLGEIEMACQTTCSRPLSELHNLCCGNLGRAELLLLASQRLQRTEYALLARNIAGQRLSFSNSDTPVSQRWSNGPFDLGLFQGLSGAGYELLRLANPNRVPSVLLWESESPFHSHATSG